jgi:G3E family GTPase
VFTSWGVETTRTFPREKLESILSELDSGKYGAVLRAKGIVSDDQGGWLHFDYVPQEHELRQGGADYTGRLCVIGSQLDEAGLKTLFEV